MLSVTDFINLNFLCPSKNNLSYCLPRELPSKRSAGALVDSRVRPQARRCTSMRKHLPKECNVGEDAGNSWALWALQTSLWQELRKFSSCSKPHLMHSVSRRQSQVLRENPDGELVDPSPLALVAMACPCGRWFGVRLCQYTRRGWLLAHPAVATFPWSTATNRQCNQPLGFGGLDQHRSVWLSPQRDHRHTNGVVACRAGSLWRTSRSLARISPACRAFPQVIRCAACFGCSSWPVSSQPLPTKARE